MISFRHHVVSLVAVLLALATGVALGGGPLSDLGRTATPELRAENADLKAQLEAADSAGGVAESVLETRSANVVAGRLNELRVAVVTLPGANEEVTGAVETAIGQAGGTLAATYALQAKAYNADGKSLVDTLGSQLAENAEGVPADASTYERLGALVGLAIAGGDDEANTSLRSSLTSAGLVEMADDARPADLVVVVAGDGASRVEAEALADLLAAIDAGVDGSVVAGTSASADAGLLAALRADGDWAAASSSVDAAETAAGVVNIVLALVADAAGGQGHYGVNGADGATPAS